MNWLRTRLQHWLQISESPKAIQFVLPTTPEPQFKRPSGGYYAEVRKAKAEVEALRDRALETLDEAKAVASQGPAKLDRALTDFENALHNMLELQRKFDAFVTLLGVAIVPDAENGPAIVAPAEGTDPFASAQRVILAELELREISKEAARARREVQALSELVRQAHRNADVIRRLAEQKPELMA